MRAFVLCIVTTVILGLCVGYTLSAKAQRQNGKKDDIVHGFDTSSLDKSTNACHDFFQYADGGWIAKNAIPAAYPEWGRFNELNERNRDVLHRILDDASRNTNAVKGSAEQKIGDFYGACMDTAKIEADGIAPLQPELDKIEAMKDTRNLQDEMVRLQSLGVSVLFDFQSGQDFTESTRVIGQVSQGGLGLPERDYYTKIDEKSKKIQSEYVKHVAKMFELLGDSADKAAAEAKTVMAIETKLAEASMTVIEQRDPNAVYHKMGIAQLKELTPKFSWTDYFQKVGRSNMGDVNVGQPEFLKTVNKMLGDVPMADWKTYYRWHLLARAANTLPQKFVDEDFNFNGKVLTGTKENLERWKRCVGGTDRRLGEALGKVYVENTFTPEAKKHALEMVQNLISVLRDDLSTLNWMSDATRKQAIVKLDAFTKKIGYPDKWLDYSTLQIDRKSFAGNSLRASEFEFKRDMSKIGQPVDRVEWGMSPPTVNAYYNPLLNEIVFPAGILQPPFYDPKADDAINYGGMGAVIGHEMTHGFDDQGSQFDADGNLKDWWTPDDKKNFESRASCVEKQFDEFIVKGDLHMQGKLVVGESIADLGGLKVAYLALEKSLKGKPRPANIDGFTPEQRFFLGWAQVWATNLRPEYMEVLVNTDPHPIPRFRVNGPVSNLPEFAKAFSCKAGDAMVRPPEKLCQIW